MIKLKIEEGFLNMENDINEVNQFVDKHINDILKAFRSASYEIDIDSRREETIGTPTGIKKAVIFNIRPKNRLADIRKLSRRIGDFMRDNYKFGYNVAPNHKDIIIFF